LRIEAVRAAERSRALALDTTGAPSRPTLAGGGSVQLIVGVSGTSRLRDLWSSVSR